MCYFQSHLSLSTNNPIDLSQFESDATPTHGTVGKIPILLCLPTKQPQKFCMCKRTKLEKH